MDYTEKYNAALERANVAYKDEDRHLKATLERIFPELAESDGEKIRKELIDAIQGLWANDALPMPLSVKRKDSWIAWLEKQGKQEPISITDEWIEDYWQHEKVINFDTYDKGEEIQFDHYGFVNFCKRYCKKPVERNEDNEKIRKSLINFLKSPFINENITDEKVAPWITWLEKQGEQSSDKVEPKFKAGKWYQCTKDFFGKGVTFDKNTAYYCAQEGCLQNKYGCHIAIVKDLYDNFKLWTIADAKDGDVVVDKSDGTIGIFQSIGHHPDGGSYNDPSYCFLHCRYDDGFFYADFEYGNTIVSDDLIPATKEQRDLLFAKMKEAGYEWNNEKKELKKIEPKTLDADKVIGWLRQHSCAACWDNSDEGVSQCIEQFKKDFEI